MNTRQNYNSETPLQSALSAKTLLPKALAELVTQSEKKRSVFRNAEVKVLYDAAISFSSQACDKEIEKLISLGRSIIYIFDIYLPKVVQKLGEAWVSDKLTFAEVTIATSRIQLLGNKYENLYLENKWPDFHSPEVLLILPQKQTHTFGIVSANRIFKRLGASTHLAIDSSDEAVENLITQHDFELIGISASLGCEVSSLNRIIDKVRKQTKNKIPIIIGGSMLQMQSWPHNEIRSDLVTNDPAFALKHYNLTNKDCGSN